MKGARHCGRGREILCGADGLGESVDGGRDDELEVRGRERGDGGLGMYRDGLEGTIERLEDREGNGSGISSKR